MIRPFNGKMPKIADSAFVSESAYVVGDVEIGENSGVWPGAVIRADFGSIRIGKDCQIEDNSVVHAGGALEIGDNVIIGHSVVVHGRKIGNDVLIGNNATILDFAEIGEHCIIGANSMVATAQKIPDNSFAVGAPAKIKQLSLDKMKEAFERMVARYSGITTKGIDGFSYSELVKKYREQGL
jgi:carbonic anhydrase/acetyltransferase-like protein (isoleucine patch superfamily)